MEPAMQPEVIYLYSEEYRDCGFNMIRVSAVRGGKVLHQVQRWSQMAAMYEMRRWLARNVNLIEVYNHAN